MRKPAGALAPTKTGWQGLSWYLTARIISAPHIDHHEEERVCKKGAIEEGDKGGHQS